MGKNEKTTNKMVQCICPMCGRKHKLYIYWKGNGTPRKFCLSCKKQKPLTEEDIEYSISLPSDFKPTLSF